jgi:hypothetical protein
MSASLDGVYVTAADFNGVSWDGSPFKLPIPDWLLPAILLKQIVPDTRGHADYTEFNVNTPDGPMRAGPGDYIARQADGTFIVMKYYEINKE